VELYLSETVRQLPLFYHFLTANSSLSSTTLPLEKDTFANAIILFAWNDKLECFALAIHFSTVFVDKVKIILMNEPLSKNLASGDKSLQDYKTVATILPFSHSKQFVVTDDHTFRKKTHMPMQ
jgi:hypothetical protein